MSDRIAILRGGRLVQVDTPEGLHDRPTTAFVASFIGEATLLPASRAGDGISVGGTILRCDKPLPSAGRLILAVQTEKLMIADPANGPQDPALNHFLGRVTDVIYQGESLRVFVALDGGLDVSLRQPAHHLGRLAIPAIGDPITVLLHPRDTIVVAGDEA